MGFKFGEIPPGDALVYWQSKVPVTAREFYKLEAQARATAFTVSGLTRLEQVQAVHTSLAKALEEGQGFKSWKKEILNKLPKEWAGKSFRLETIYRTNVQTAYCMGRYKQMMEVAENRPYWRYSSILDGRTRPAHSLLHGKIKRHDDPFWDVWFPPNGFRCRCTVTSLSERDMKRKGYTENKELKSGDFVTSDEYPMGFYLLPDRNFGTNPAKTFWKPDFKKYDEALGQATEKAIRRVTGSEPLGVKTRADMVNVIKEKLAPLAGQGIKKVEFTSMNALMSTDAEGRITISTNKFASIGMTPSKDLLNAFKKLGTGKKLSFNEEYSLESLWHEIQHNNQKFTARIPDKDHYSYALMETINQWVSRRTYPRMMNKLGGYEPAHLEKVQSDGYGYGMYISRFDALLKTLGVDGMEILSKMERMHREIGAFDYEPELRRLLSGKSGKDEKKISQCLKAIREKSFSICLEEL